MLTWVRPYPNLLEIASIILKAALLDRTNFLYFKDEDIDVQRG
jgi:hypothetical protein